MDETGKELMSHSALIACWRSIISGLCFLGWKHIGR